MFGIIGINTSNKSDGAPSEDPTRVEILSGLGAYGPFHWELSQNWIFMLKCVMVMTTAKR